MITPRQIHVLVLNELSPDEVLANYASRAIHVAGEVLIGGIGAATVLDLERDREMVAEFLTRGKGVYSMTIAVTTPATSLVDGAGIPVIDFRDVTPTAEQLAAMATDPRIAGAFVSHSDGADAERPSWQLWLKPIEIRRLRHLGLVKLDISSPQRSIRARFAGFQLTTRKVAQLIIALGSLATALGILLHAVGAA